MLVLVGLLLIFGIVMLYSTSYAAFGERFLLRQLIWVAVGTTGALVVWRLDYRKLGRVSTPLLVAVGLALGYLFLAFVIYRFEVISREAFAHLPLVTERPIKGSFRWLRISQFSLQPSEFAKPVLVLYLADYFNRHARHIMEFRRGFLKPMFVSGVVLGLIFLGRDFSTAAITGAVVVTLAFVAGVRMRYLLLLTACGVAFGYAAIRFDSMRMRRMMSFQDPEKYAQKEGYQLWHSQLALGSGGRVGQGLTESRLKQLYLPEAHTDFIVAIIGEELGFVGTAALLALYALLVGTAFWIAVLSRDRLGALLCIGVGVSIGIHAFVNISVVSGFCPTTGVTAPFLSYGGSSMIASLAGIGFLLSVCRVSESEYIAEGQRRLAEFDYGPKDAGEA